MMSSIVSCTSRSLKMNCCLSTSGPKLLQGVSKFQSFPCSFTAEVSYFQTRSKLRKSKESHILLYEEKGQKCNILLYILCLLLVWCFLLGTKYDLMHSRLHLRVSLYTDTSKNRRALLRIGSSLLFLSLVNIYECLIALNLSAESSSDLSKTFYFT